MWIDGNTITYGVGSANDSCVDITNYGRGVHNIGAAILVNIINYC
jgi:hypothetical protein